MAVKEILLEQIPDKTYRLTLSGRDYDFRVKYLQRLTNVAKGKPVKADEFSLSIALAGEEPEIYSSLKTNRDILQSHRYKSSCPEGMLMLRDVTADNELAKGNSANYSPERNSYEEIGERFKLIYVTP
ncbi:conserved hypothetical protein [Vibrio phage 193E37-1]|nr:conserved hypothetical protein [Vibrio phage 495E54-1]CAH9012905.1 conserved hypothetical protein [Vibrio phage 277E43-1]CAH9013053.1 conserved hypothetical protein [Vibrio phage 496E54-1]CAH9016742.1 conserved hypothetical protein [Vibrio phage 193E37-1]